MRDMSACSFFFRVFCCSWKGFTLEREPVRLQTQFSWRLAARQHSQRARSPQGDDASAEDIGRVQGSGVSGGQGALGSGGGERGKTAAGCWKTPDSTLRGRRGQLLQARRRWACLPRPGVRRQGRTWPRSRCWVRPPAAGVEPPPR